MSPARVETAALMYQVPRMLRGSGWEKQMVMFQLSLVKAVLASMMVERGGYRQQGRAVDALPHHTPPSVVQPRIFV